ncbi:hypothetical protein A3H85_03110 [Candidatus Daviesbacteria bacterium RIFCSPLOWO2_02_FULL_40_8]|uniref:Uncharacterized protein n=1 Tax=Candidatus Daviesbacteria bacterium RIFCSPLOWO2_01_FULL_40_24 TaxID=1797787 RepID=A0A1F5MJ72_9BACT|nr:MAG: hypothetical protein A2780_00335 [Candidatus Daviesbacteria bacterium RIFCSPHIGHO2_01_FULL_41_45]OGE34467.1 MAG: hypothetical protein A3C32_03935 [Candidatus Daviesbacteria bacterium RIFCSPHIGHO2_02_FULL_41_14]OGE65379.1 MAG: hypothetical protein A3B49_00630 [Candidatus Daviesbacteria bacterium RIFCSPLOWO2_01_FULL_40_24]OGE66761.1 MAG: hypothetical protein A3H85_03110 [Candidatus Daviesbacteria bacterium RIFCSPLOWO2_02_FULL_40_8]
MYEQARRYFRDVFGLKPNPETLKQYYAGSDIVVKDTLSPANFRVFLLSLPRITDGSMIDVWAMDLSKLSFAFNQSSNGHRDTRDLDFPHITLPLGPLEGNYFSGLSFSSKFSHYTTAHRVDYGSQTIVHRFPNGSEFNEPFSGGLAVNNKGELKIVDQEGIRKSSNNKSAVAQLVYSANSDNFATLMAQDWHHFGKKETIGNSLGSWCWWLQWADKTVYFSPVKRHPLHKEPLTFQDIYRINNVFTENLDWTTAIGAQGLSGGFAIRDQGKNLLVNPSPAVMHHSSPAVLIASHKSIDIR